mmetsp:Transcript_17811/g.45178  ORF Transcript_17811/g.45178 Transcript_17811/m.45178 type:complete len:404 (+) Transcript_17811:754-1965(+)
MHGLCIWHLLDRGMIDKKITAGSLSDKGKLLFKVLTQWMYSWSSSVESNAEFSVSYELFIRWIKPDEVASELTQSFVTKILNFLTQNVLPLRKKWVRDEKRARCRGFGKRGTSFAEAENSVLKTHPLGTRPHHSAKRAVRTIARLDQVRLRQKRKLTAAALDETPSEGNIPRLHDNVNLNAVKIGLEQCAATSYFLALKISESEFWVSLSEFEQFTEERLGAPGYTAMLIPKFLHTRRVKILEVNGSRYLLCSCGLLESIGIACRHIYAVLDRLPKSGDFIARWHKKFSSYFGECEKMTSIFREAMAKEPPGVPIEECDLAGWAEEECATAEMKALFAKQLPGEAPVLKPFTFWRPSVCENDNGPIHLGTEMLDTARAESGGCPELSGLVRRVSLTENSERHE